MATTDQISLGEELEAIRISGDHLAARYHEIPSDHLPGPEFFSRLKTKIMQRCCLLLSAATEGKKLPRLFQLEATLAILSGRDSLINAGTGSGKTLCVVLPALLIFHDDREEAENAAKFLNSICHESMRKNRIAKHYHSMMSEDFSSYSSLFLPWSVQQFRGYWVYAEEQNARLLFCRLDVISFLIRSIQIRKVGVTSQINSKSTRLSVEVYPHGRESRSRG